MAYASFSDVEIYVPDLAEEDEPKVEVLLEQAEAEILLEFPDLDARVADGRTRLVLLQRVEAEMVASVMRNPNAWTSSSEGIGGLSESHGFNLAAASGLLVFTDKHRAMVNSSSTVAGSGGGGAFTIRPGGRYVH